MVLAHESSFLYQLHALPPYINPRALLCQKTTVDIGIKVLLHKATYVTFSIVYRSEKVLTESLIAKDRLDQIRRIKKGWVFVIYDRLAFWNDLSYMTT